MATESHVIITYLLDLRLQDDCCGLLNHSLCNIRLLMASRDECAKYRAYATCSIFLFIIRSTTGARENKVILCFDCV